MKGLLYVSLVTLFEAYKDPTWNRFNNPSVDQLSRWYSVKSASESVKPILFSSMAFASLEVFAVGTVLRSPLSWDGSMACSGRVQTPTVARMSFWALLD